LALKIFLAEVLDFQRYHYRETNDNSTNHSSITKCMTLEHTLLKTLNNPSAILSSSNLIGS